MTDQPGFGRESRSTVEPTDLDADLATVRASIDDMQSDNPEAEARTLAALDRLEEQARYGGGMDATEASYLVEALEERDAAYDVLRAIDSHITKQSLEPDDPNLYRAVLLVVQQRARALLDSITKGEPDA